MGEFVVPESGTYHVASGMTPHLVAECTSACDPASVIGSTIVIGLDAAPVSLVLDYAVTERTENLTTTFAAWEEYPRGDRPSS